MDYLAKTTMDYKLQNVIDYKRKQILGTAKLKKYA